MTTLDYTRKRTLEFIEEIDRVSKAEFPHHTSREALECIKKFGLSKLNDLQGCDERTDPNTVKGMCAQTLNYVSTYLPFVGIILRSTSIRNAFELFGPFFRLACSVLEPDTPQKDCSIKLILSSEWNYSPFTRSISGPSNFVFIGLPAPESENPLLSPLVGHELGHTLWHRKKLEDAIKPIIRNEVVDATARKLPEFQRIFGRDNIKKKSDLEYDLLTVSAWEGCIASTLKQAQESFCDFTGLYIFGESYLNAFAYLLSPGTQYRSPHYPRRMNRVQNLIKAAEEYGLAYSPNYRELFNDDPPSEPVSGEEFWLSVADQALDSFVPDLINRAKACIPLEDKQTDKIGIVRSTSTEVERIYARFKHVVPAERCTCLADILNAAWKAFSDTSLWKDLPLYERKDRVLKELVLKNIETFQIEQIQTETP